MHVLSHKPINIDITFQPDHLLEVVRALMAEVSKTDFKRWGECPKNTWLCIQKPGLFALIQEQLDLVELLLLS